MDESIFAQTAGWAIVSSVVLPYLIAFVNRPTWTPKTKKAVAVAAAVVGGVLTSLATGAFTAGGPVTVLSAVGITLVGSQTMYATIMKKSAKAVEEATSPHQSEDEPEPEPDAPSVVETEPEKRSGQHRAPE